jgi:predicted PurR-regulated permease PerM
MKKLLTLSLISFFLLLPTSLSFGQELENDIPDDVEIQILEEEDDTEEKTIEEDQEASDQQESLSETLDDQQKEETQPPSRSFWTILGAILIPSLFIIICYFILKAFQ